ncbi:MAG: MCE family protein [Bradyrhizobium sp.]|jgi:phospholipid/cholesterol/gamma-HCH transport system substrate-binding protein|uniref:MlaD family protein n=1 Tax=Bradyrhizobium sp. TaxID=376 RepID=UPI001220D4EE|nr:MlaD family protein [Bradyrhizobium sp.]THD53934.1 MAG: MCE family protein [Bradyrhizobium sp.]
MKARASNLMIGTTTLAVIAAAFVGVLGFRKIHSIQQRGPLRIVFEGSASGLQKGGSVNFDGVQVGEILSLKLDNPRKIVAFTRVDNTAPIRKDTVVGLEFQGLTGVAAISLTGGAAEAPPVPLDADGVPTLTADLSEIQSIRDTLHSVDRILVGNQATIKDGLLSFETYTASLAGKGDAIEQVLGKANNAFASFDSAVTKIDNVIPGLADGKADELFEKVKSIREFAETFNKKSGAFIEEGRRSLLDISEGAVKVTRKFNPQAVSGGNPPPPRKPNPKRQ